MSTAVNANVRVLELFVELLGARPGRTKAQLRELPGYQGLADDALRPSSSAIRMRCVTRALT